MNYYIGNDMKVNIIIASICFILIFSSITLLAHSKEINLNTLYVDDDNINGPWEGTIQYPYQYIQNAIDNASDQDIIYVFNGTYFENIKINISINLEGESKCNSIIDGRKINNTITVNRENVKISNFTITNSSQDDKTLWWKAGIRITKSNCKINDNIIQNNLLGIFGKQVTNITIHNNRFYNDSINFYPYDTGNHGHPTFYLDYYTHNIINNTVNGNPLIYIKDKNDYEITSNVGQIIALNCSNIRVHNVTITHSDFSLMLINCGNCIIENSNISQNNGALTLLQSNNNIIRNNTITQDFHGILLDYNSCGNEIINNKIINNRFCGIVCESYSNQNQIIHNTFINNKNKNAFVIFSYKNQWENNYWDNWIGVKYGFLPFLPKVIYGRFKDIKFNLPFNFDLNPSTEPFN
jgi:nitrous oxidase accessory protein NosD